MKSNTEFKPEQSFGLLLVGEPKTGKTSVALSFPRPYIQDWDRNLLAAVNRDPEKQFWYDNPYETDDGQPVEDKDLWELNINKRLKAALANPEIETVIIDSISTLSQALAYHIAYTTTLMEGRKQPPADSELLATGNVRPGDKGIIGGLLRLQDYQIFQTMMIRLVAYMRKFPKMIVWTSHQKIRENELNGIKQFRLNMPGSLADNFGGFYSDVWGTSNTTDNPPKFFIHTAPSVRHTELGTSLKLPGKIEITGLTPSQIWNDKLSPLLSPQAPIKK